MRTKTVTVSRETGTFASEITEYLLRRERLERAAAQFKCLVEDWIIKNNGNRYRFPAGSTLNVPLERTEYMRYFSGNLTGQQNGITTTPIVAGWKLTRRGQLIQGSTGWLIDENGLYILEDGRRVTEEIINRDTANCKKLGDEDITTGFMKIMVWGERTQFLSDEAEQMLLRIRDRIDTEYNLILNTGRLLLDHGETMHEVAYQAFQINKCYTTQMNEEVRINNNAVYYSIGKDETGIPIIVTRVGRENAAHKLVIAGPHGDERNAQRLIMAAQRYFTFTREGTTADTALYFIPCLSPTMCFADARGIPKEFLDGTGPFRVKGSLTIPLLHDAMTGSLRNSLQKQLDPANPNVGVDANRDYYESLVSTRTFRAFMDNIKAGCDTSGNNMRTTTTIIYDTVDSKELDPITCSTVRYLCVLMIHGYEEGGAVYGPYAVARKEPNQEWPARMSDADKAYVNDIRSELSWGELGKISISAENFNNDNPPDDPYLYGKKYSEEEQRRTSIRSNATEYDAREYRGEWSTSLYLKNIWSADIELPQGAYDEGIRGDTGRPYEEQMGRIGNLGVVFNQFVNLLGNFPWQDE